MALKGHSKNQRSNSKMAKVDPQGQGHLKFFTVCRPSIDWRRLASKVLQSHVNKPSMKKDKTEAAVVAAECPCFVKKNDCD